LSEIVWVPKIICRSWQHWPLECPWHHYDGGTNTHYCCHRPRRQLEMTCHGSPKRRPDCPIGPMRIEDKSHRPRRQA
jgi:hypothetical protein